MPFWWAKLTSYPQFVELLAERWLGLRAGMLSLGAIEARVGAYNATVGSAEARNFAQFDLLKKFVYGGRLLLWTGGWNRWLESMGGIGGWNRWVESVGGIGGWNWWVELVGGIGGWNRWVESVGGRSLLAGIGGGIDGGIDGKRSLLVGIGGWRQPRFLTLHFVQFLQVAQRVAVPWDLQPAATLYASLDRGGMAGVPLLRNCCAIVV